MASPSYHQETTYRTRSEPESPSVCSGLSIAELRDLVPTIREQLDLEPHQKMARCPFHDDGSPSLSVFRGRDGLTRWKCHSGCGGGDALDLAARLDGCEVRDLIRRLRRQQPAPRARRQGPPRQRTRSKPSSPPRPDPETQAEVAQLWDEARACIRGPEGADVRSYLVQRLGERGATEAVKAGLVGALPPRARWRGRPLGQTHRLVIPTFPMPGRESLGGFGSAGALEPQPADLVRRRFDQEHPRYLSLPGATGGATVTFGSLADELVEADSSALVIVEGALNAVAWKVLNPGRGVIGLHGARTAHQVALAVARELELLRRDGCEGPPLVVVDTDTDEAGRRARADIARVLTPAALAGLDLRDFVRPHDLDAADLLKAHGAGGKA